MRRVVSLTLLCSLGTVPVFGQQQRQLFLTIAGPSGTTVPAPQPTDVTVLEDDVACRTVKVEPVTWPIKLTVMVDNGTFSPMYLNELRIGLRGLFSALPADVEVSLQSLAPQPRWVVKPTSSRQEVLDGIDLIAPDNRGGQEFDALVDAGNRMEKDANAFPVILLFMTDLGGGNIREQQLDKLRKQVAEHGATVHVVLLSLGNLPPTTAEQGGAPPRRPGSAAPAPPGRNSPPSRGIPPNAAPVGQTNQGEGLPREFGLVRGALQTQVGLTLTKQSGGRFENISAGTRLATLLPELGELIALSDARQRREVRVTYEPPGNRRNKANKVTARVAPQAGAIFSISLDGHLP